MVTPSDIKKTIQERLVTAQKLKADARVHDSIRKKMVSPLMKQLATIQKVKDELKRAKMPIELVANNPLEIAKNSVEKLLARIQGAGGDELEGMKEDMDRELTT